MTEIINIPGGRGATQATLNVMARLASAAALSMQFRNRMADLMLSFFPGNPAGYVAAAVAYVQSSVKIVDEPDEIIQAPGFLLDEIDKGRAFGDCDDMVTLAVAIVKTAGIPVRFKAVFPHETEGYYRHVILEWFSIMDGYWHPVDVTPDGGLLYPRDYLIKEV